jgi:hypothetical protein
MRRIIASVLALSPLCWGVPAFAQDPAPAAASSTATTTSATDGASTSTTTTTSVAPPTSTTTTTQATVDTTPGVEVAPPVSHTEAGATETTTFVNRPLLVTGLLFFGGTYAASAGVAAESTRPADNPNLYYPVVGPWMDLAQRDCSATRPCSGETGNKTLLILDGITQDIGALAVLTSFFIPEKKSRHWFIVGSDSLHAAPASVGSGYGMAAAGHF